MDTGCDRWPERLRLRASGPDGVRFVKGRCRATNQCSYCAKLAAIETAEMLWLDALNGSAPTLWLTLTTRSADPSPAAFFNARRALWRSVKRRWPGAEYAALVEFSTGYGARSGGKRRPHWNVGVKGVPADDAPEFYWNAVPAWCRNVDALPDGQHVQPLHDAAGFIRYVALHFQKESQAPPAGWRGHRFVSSWGYFAQGATRARIEAREHLQAKRDLWKAGELLGWHAHPALEDGAAYLRRKREATEWELCVIKPGGALHPLRKGSNNGHGNPSDTAGERPRRASLDESSALPGVR